MSLSILDRIAAKIEPELGGIDWVALEKRFNIPREEIVYHTGVEVSDSGFAAYQEYIKAAHDKCWAAVSTLTMTWDVKDDPSTVENEQVLAVKAWDQLEREVIDLKDVVLEALESQVAFLSQEDALLMDKERLRAVVSQIYTVALYGAVSHKNLLMQMANVAPEDIVDNANDITRSFNALTKLVDTGVLNSLKKEQSATQGLGALPVVVVAILLVAGVAIIVWCILAIVKQIEVNKAIKLMCAEAARTGSKEDKERCSHLVEMSLMATSGGPGSVGNPLDNLKNTLGGGVLWIGLAAVAGLVLLSKFGSKVTVVSK